jgi:hypothetical protein
MLLAKALSAVRVIEVTFGDQALDQGRLFAKVELPLRFTAAIGLVAIIAGVNQRGEPALVTREKGISMCHESKQQRKGLLPLLRR